MSREHPSVFISYSWDSEKHEDWVTVLATKLRENGVAATIDKFETQSRTVNLNRMMVEKIKIVIISCSFLLRTMLIKQILSRVELAMKRTC